MLVRLGSLALFLAAIAYPAVERILLKERTDVADGMAYGSAGPYERIAGTVQFRLDPKLPQNRGIVDLGLAQVNRDGLVEFTADILVYKPRDPAKGNGTAIIDVPNRGRILSFGAFNRATGSLDPQKASDFGDGFLMNQGFTVVSIGWQWDTPPVPGRLGLHAPQLREPITGLARAEFVPDKSITRFSLGDRDHVPYPVADERDAANRMTVRDAPGLPRREIPRAKWHFVDKTSVELEGGCEPGKIYEVVYRAGNPVPVGLGFAAVRDIASFFKYGESPFLLGDQRRFIKRTIGFGTSQTGRFLRHMMYEGFNEDEKGRMGLDGVWSHVAGAGRGSFNVRFGQPSRDGQPVLHYSWPVDLYPFADVAVPDALTGKNEGLLARVMAAKVRPKIFYTNGSYEYWGRAASLIHTTPDGSRDLPDDPSTRIYLLAGAQHGPGSLPIKRTNTTNLNNPLDQRWAMRALLLDMHAWLKDGVEPPASVHPRIASGELVAPGKVKYPDFVKRPEFQKTPLVLDFGPEFSAKGIISVEPPKEGAAYTILMPQVDATGNELGGVRMTELDVPLGVYTGWNFRAASIGSSDRMIAFIGSFFPLPDAQRKQGSKDAYLAHVKTAAETLVSRRLAVDADVPKILARAEELWAAVPAAK